MHNFKLTSLLFLALGLSTMGWSQSDLHTYLQAVEQNNPSLQAALKLNEANKAEAKIGLTPSNPVVNYGRMPGSTKAMGTKTVFGISQEFNFPTTYKTQNNVAKQKSAISDWDFQVVRQEVLLDAQLTYIEYTFVTKQKEELEKRLLSSKKWLKFYQAKLDIGGASIIEYNKAKIQFLSASSKLKMLNQELESKLSKLKMLVGDNALTFDKTEYPKIETLQADSLKANYQRSSPQMIWFKQQNQLAKLQVKNAKHQVLPNFEVSYEGEKSMEGSYRGVNAGMSIPIWQDKNKIKQAQLASKYVEANAYSQQAILLNSFEVAYQRMQEYNALLQEYRKVMDSSIHIEHLDKALQLGELSVMDYFTELSFYYETIDNYLSLEKEFFSQQAQVYQFQL